MGLADGDGLVSFQDASIDSNSRSGIIATKSGIGRSSKEHGEEEKEDGGENLHGAKSLGDFFFAGRGEGKVALGLTMFQFLEK